MNSISGSRKSGSKWRRFFACGLIILGFLINQICSKGDDKDEMRNENDDLIIPMIDDRGGVRSMENGGKTKSKNETKHGQLYLPVDYNKFEIPDEAKALGLNPSPLNVKVHIRIREIGDLDELDEKLTITLDVRLWWKDWQIFKANQKGATTDEGFNFVDDPENTSTKPKKLDPSFLLQIWKPDLFIESLVSTARPEFIAKPVKVVFTSDGTLVVQSRVTITVDCNMDFHFYPADIQECPFNIRSYAFESSEMELEWGHPKPSVYVFDRRNTNFEIQLTEPKLLRLSESSLDLPDVFFTFSFGGETTTPPPPPQPRNETFDILQFSIKARRRLSYHLVQTYLPSLFFIGITWLCFVFPPRMVEVRIGITMTTLLTMTAMFSSVRESTPIVSYIKAIDIWMIACIAFVFFILLEFAALVWFGLADEESEDTKMKETEGSSRRLMRKEDNVSEEFELRERRANTRIESPAPSESNPLQNKIREKVTKKSGSSSRTITLERIVMGFFLLLFSIFVVLYWILLLNNSQYFDWTLDPTYNAADEE